MAQGFSSLATPREYQSPPRGCAAVFTSTGSKGAIGIEWKTKLCWNTAKTGGGTSEQRGGKGADTVPTKMFSFVVSCCSDYRLGVCGMCAQAADLI